MSALQYQAESVMAIWEEAQPLLVAHWREIAHYQDIALEPDREMYAALDAAGTVRCYTARAVDQKTRFKVGEHVAEPIAQSFVGLDGKRVAMGGGECPGQLVGYVVFFLRHNPHYKSSLQAVQDVLFLLPEHRRGRAGITLIRVAETRLRAEGVQVVYHHAKRTNKVGELLGRLGYELVDEIYAKRLDV